MLPKRWNKLDSRLDSSWTTPERLDVFGYPEKQERQALTCAPLRRLVTLHCSCGCLSRPLSSDNVLLRGNRFAMRRLRGGFAIAGKVQEVLGENYSSHKVRIRGTINLEKSVRGKHQNEYTYI